MTNNAANNEEASRGWSGGLRQFLLGVRLALLVALPIYTWMLASKVRDLARWQERINIQLMNMAKDNVKGLDKH